MYKRSVAIGASILLSQSGVIWASDLPIVTVVAVDDHASEIGPDTATLLFTRESAAIDKPLEVAFTLSGTATPGVDYVNPGLVIRFPPQVPMVTLTIRPIPDTLTEGDETVILMLAEKSGLYRVGESRQAQVIIADSSTDHASGKPSGNVPGAVDPTRSAPTGASVFERSGALSVSITLDGSGSWRSQRTGEYADHKFHRVLSYTVPLTGFYGFGSGFTEIDRRNQAGGFGTPNFRRYLVLQPTLMIGTAGKPCGNGTIEFLDERKGTEVGDPGQPPLVPFVETVKGGGSFPSGDKTVSERDLCQTLISFDYDKHVYHLRIDGSDSFVKTLNVHNGHAAPAAALPLAGYDNGQSKPKLTFFDLPLPANATGVEGTRVLENFSVVSGTQRSQFPLRATVRWRITTQPKSSS